MHKIVCSCTCYDKMSKKYEYDYQLVHYGMHSIINELLLAFSIHNRAYYAINQAILTILT